MRTVSVLFAGLVLGLLAPGRAAAQPHRLIPPPPPLPWNWKAIELEELARERSRSHPSSPASSSKNPGHPGHPDQSAQQPQMQKHRYPPANATAAGFHPRVRVQAPTSLDWQFTVSKDSVWPLC
jgi:hypothetical protein